LRLDDLGGRINRYYQSRGTELEVRVPLPAPI
jgi:hypothetical protein